MSMLSFAADLLDPPDNVYLDDPAGWMRDQLGEHLWSAQSTIAESVRDHRYTAVPSAHNTGKSFIAGRLAAWWLAVHPVGEAFVVTTAPTFPQVRAILWKEINRAHRAGNLPGRVNQTEWWMSGEIVAYGRKPANYDQEAFQGIHQRYVLVILDEACGIPKSLFDAADTLATNRYARVLAIGNPDDPSAHFKRICRPDSGWNVVHVDGLGSPGVDRPSLEAAFDDIGYGRDGRQAELRDQVLAETPEETEDVPPELYPLLLSPIWVAERADRWGVGSPLWDAKVRGRFPTGADNTVIPLSWVKAAQQRWRSLDSFGPLTCLGVDVARYGDDNTVIAERAGSAIVDLWHHSKQSTTQTTTHVIRRMRPGMYAVVDVVGIGSGVVDQLRDKGFDVGAFSAGAGTDMVDESGKVGFVNVRSAAWWHLRLLLDPDRGANLALPPDEKLEGDLTAPKWEVRAGDRIAVEKKRDVKERLGRSTDDGDAVVQAFWPPTFWREPSGEYDVGERVSISPV